MQLEDDSEYLIPFAAAESERSSRRASRGLRGLFVGGTFCYEAQLLLKNLPEPVYSNAPLAKANQLDPAAGHKHTIVDLGEDEFTQGRLHPMIDPSLRNRRIVQEAAHDPSSRRDPARLRARLRQPPRPGRRRPGRDPGGPGGCRARRATKSSSWRRCAGPSSDPQRLGEQEAKLRAAGVLVLPDNASAARLAGLITQGNPEQSGRP